MQVVTCKMQNRNAKINNVAILPQISLIYYILAYQVHCFASDNQHKEGSSLFRFQISVANIRSVSLAVKQITSYV